MLDSLSFSIEWVITGEGSPASRCGDDPGAGPSNPCIRRFPVDPPDDGWPGPGKEPAPGGRWWLRCQRRRSNPDERRLTSPTSVTAEGPLKTACPDSREESLVRH